MVSLGKSTLTLYEDTNSRNATERTFLLFGMIRGGTTAATMIAHRLGLPIGEQYGDNLEDKDFFKGPAIVRSTITKRNAEHSVWGVKLPNGAFNLDGLTNQMRNPRLICITRDMTAQILGVKKYSHDESAELTMQRHVLSIQRNVMAVSRLRLPTLFLSYEKILSSPDDAITEMATFMNLNAGRKVRRDIKETLVPGEYQAIGNAP